MFFDVTAGRRARRIRLHREGAEFGPDPTDPCAEERLAAESEPLGAPGPVLDPTDPRNGEPAA